MKAWYSEEVKYAIEKDKPLLGICLGMQTISIMNSRKVIDKVDTTIKIKTVMLFHIYMTK